MTTSAATISSIGAPTLLSHGDEGPPTLDASWAFSNLADTVNCFAPNLRHVVALVEDQVGAGLYNARRLAKYLKQVCTLLHANSSEVRSTTKHENEKKSRVANDSMQLTVRLFETIQDVIEEQAAITQQFSMNVLKAVVDPLMTFHKDADQKRLKILATDKAITARNQATAKAIEKARREAIDAWLDLKKMALEGDFPVLVESLNKFTKSSGSKKRHIRTFVLYPSGVLLWGDGKLGETTLGANCIERVVGVSRSASSELKLSSDEAERFFAIATTGKTLKVLCDRKESVEQWTSTVLKILAGKTLDEEKEKTQEKEKHHTGTVPPPPPPRDGSIISPIMPPSTSFNPTTGAAIVPLSSLPVQLTPAASSGEKAAHWKKERERIENNFKRLQKAIVRTQKLFTTMEQLVVAANKELDTYYTQELPELLEGLEKLEMTRLNVTKFFITKFAQLHGLHVEPSDQVRHSIKRTVSSLDSASQVMRFCENLVAQHSLPPAPQPYTDMLPCHWTLFTTTEYIKVQNLLCQDVAKVIEARNKGLIEPEEQEEKRKRKAETKQTVTTSEESTTSVGGRTLVLPGGALVGLSAAGEKPVGEAFPEPVEEKETKAPTSEEASAQKQAFVASINEYRETLEKLGTLSAEDEQYFSSFWDMDNLRKLNIYFEVLHSKTRRVKLLVLMKYFPLRFPQSEQIKLFLQNDNWFLWLLPLLQFPDKYQKNTIPKEDQDLENRLNESDWKRLFGLILSVVMQVVRLGFDTFSKENKMREFLTQMFTTIADRCSWGTEAIMFGRLQLWMLTNTIISDWSKRALPRFTEPIWDNLFDLLYVIKEFLFFRPVLDPAATFAHRGNKKEPQPGLHLDDRGCLDLPLVGRVVALLELLVNKFQGQLMEYSPKKEKDIAMRIAEEAQFFLLLYESFNPNNDKDESNVGWHYSSERASRLLDFLRKKQYPYPSAKQMERMLSSINLVVTQYRSKKQLGDFAKFAGTRYYSEHYGARGKNSSTTVRAVAAPVSGSVSSRGKKSTTPSASVATTPTASSTHSLTITASSITRPSALTKPGETKSDSEPETHVMDPTEFNTMVAKSLMAATKLRSMSIVSGGPPPAIAGRSSSSSSGSSPPRSRENSSDLVEDGSNPESPSPRKPRLGLESPPVSPGDSNQGSAFFPSQPPELPASPPPPLPPTHPSFVPTSSPTNHPAPVTHPPAPSSPSSPHSAISKGTTPVLPAAPRPTSPVPHRPTYTLSPTRAKPINIIRVKQPVISSSQLVDEASSDSGRRATSPPSSFPSPTVKPVHKRSRGVTLEPGDAPVPGERVSDTSNEVPASIHPLPSSTQTPLVTTGSSAPHSSASSEPSSIITPLPSTTVPPPFSPTVPPPLPSAIVPSLPSATPQPQQTVTPPPLPTASTPLNVTPPPPLLSSVTSSLPSASTPTSPVPASPPAIPPPLPFSTAAPVPTMSNLTPSPTASSHPTLFPLGTAPPMLSVLSPPLLSTITSSHPPVPSQSYIPATPPPLPVVTTPPPLLSAAASLTPTAQSVPRDPTTPSKEIMPPPRPPPGRAGNIVPSSSTLGQTSTSDATPSTSQEAPRSPPPRPLNFIRSSSASTTDGFAVIPKETPPPPRPRGSALTPGATGTIPSVSTSLPGIEETSAGPSTPGKEGPPTTGSFTPGKEGPPPRPSGAVRGPPPLPSSFRSG